ncbi:MAG: flippase-like domain-containing protein [Candidatus Nitrohelix vancouverensis]|uniref:Flippase-like domain-containing protein n=1 Tax=Candidatus Nitrohelix vancouverensis TaxID=2705534 RepID=A0A7T0C2Y3_9BACT|nr:MAG: flippase-like domain-containing protein [Candidatus Nitrohelix vancouverensis]
MFQPLKIIFLLLGLALFVWAVQMVDLGQTLALLKRLGIGFLYIMLIYCAVTVLDTLSWKYNFYPAESARFSLWQCWRIRQIGEAYNVITPLGTLGGEPVKAQLLKDKHGISLRQGLASQVIARTTFLTALVLFFVPGLYMIFASEQVSPLFKQTSLAGMVGFTIAIFLFFLFQITGSLGKITRWASVLPFSGRLRPLLGKLDGLSIQMGGFYRENRKRVFISILFALVGWIVGLAELYVTLYFLGIETSLSDLWIIESLAQLIRVGSFFIPLSLGAQEGGLILIFSALGMTADIGLTVSFVRRIKELLWVGLGLFLAWQIEFKPSEKISEEI